MIERTLVLSDKAVIRGADIALSLRKSPAAQESFKQAKARVVNQFGKSYIQGLLIAHQGNITHAAQAARKNRRAFWQLIHKHGIDAQSFKPEQYRPA